MQFDGVTRIYGVAAHKLTVAHVLVVGIGGVGSWAVEALARSGVGALTLADPDDICLSNLNRQLPALRSTVGQLKVEAMAARIRDINPDCRVTCFPRFANARTFANLLDTPYHYVIDAIDGVMPKAGLIARCRERGLPVITCGGSGGKTDPGAVQVVDLAATRDDRLLAFVRKKLRGVFGFPANGPFGVPCVFSPEPVCWPAADECGAGSDSDDAGPLLAEAGARLNCDGRLGALSFVTGTFGLRAAAHVVNQLVAAST